MDTLRQPGFGGMIGIWAASVLLHFVLLGGVQYIPRAEPAKAYKKVMVNVVEKAKPAAPPAAEPEAPKAETPKPKPKAQEKKTAAPQSKQDATPPPQPVLGLSKDSFADGGKGSFAVPAGNTTMVPDEGKRLSPEEIRKLDRDLSEDAKLVDGSFIKPEYTPEAEETGLEGSFVIEVYIDTKGKVVEAELRKKIGFGMDERVLSAAKKSRFSPRKNPLGQPLAGWTELRIRLTLE